MKKKLTYALCCVAGGLAHAQTDSTVLQEATVVGESYAQLTSYQYARTSDSIALLITPALTAAEWLTAESSVHVRQYSPGAVASYSTRGANSAQNAVLWSGLNINSSATGLADLSLIPVNLFNTSMLRGGNAATFGSGAMGSVLNLDGATSPISGKRLNLHVSQQVASFNTFKTLASVIFKTRKVDSKTTFYREQSENDFTYTNHWRLPPLEETRQHAAYNQWHILQTLAYTINANHALKAEGWFNQAYRQSPNNVLATAGSAELRDAILRGTIAWHFNKHNTKLDAQYAFIHENQTYEDPDIQEGNGHLLDTNITQSHMAQVNHQLVLNSKVKWQNGLLFRHDEVSGSNRIGKQNTTSLKSGLVYKDSTINAQLLLRSEFWNSKLLPISPFFGIRYNASKWLYLAANGGYIYRIPTLNDRFWVPGGNPDLNPEHGWTVEATIGADCLVKWGRLQASATAYYSLLNDYVQWIPQGALWSPNNLKQVEIKGVDVNAKYTLTKGVWYGQIGVAGSFNSSLIQQSHIAGDQSVGKQLVYQPEVKTTANATIGYSSWYAKIAFRHVGQVRTLYTESNNMLDAYNVLDASLSKTMRISKSHITCIAAINNITNQSYQNISYFPMPGINYSLTLKLSF